MATVSTDSAYKTADPPPRELAAEQVDSLGTLLRRHPVATVAIGLGVGYLIGRLGRLMARST